MKLIELGKNNRKIKWKINKNKNKDQKVGTKMTANPIK